MPLIVEIQTSAKSRSVGWALVPESLAPNPAQQKLIQSDRPRQRVNRQSSSAAHSRDQISAKQERENHRRLETLRSTSSHEIAIPPVRLQGESNSRGHERKLTPAVRRILSSQKSFANHLADEDAWRANLPGTPVVQSGMTIHVRPDLAAKPSTSLIGKDMIIGSKMPDERRIDDSLLEDAQTDDLGSCFRQDSLPDNSQIQALLQSASPSYLDAEVLTESSDYPPPLFCETCGYWGRARCTKCGARVCGLLCKQMHDDSRCLRVYA